MFASLARALFSGLVAALVLLPFAVMSGCTYSNQSRQEGMRLYSEKMYSDAAGAFRSAIRWDPRDYHSHFYLGVCYEQMQQPQQAFQSYYTALEVMATTEEGKFDDEFRLMVIDTLAAAIARCDEREVEVNRAEQRARASQKATDWFLVAKIHRLRGDADSAIAAYRRACNWDVASFPIRKEFGLYLLDPLNQTKDAEYYLKQAYRLDPNDEAVNAALTRLGVTPLPAFKAKTVASPSASPRTTPPPLVAPATPNPFTHGGSVMAPRD